VEKGLLTQWNEHVSQSSSSFSGDGVILFEKVSHTCAMIPPEKGKHRTDQMKRKFILSHTTVSPQETTHNILSIPLDILNIIKSGLKLHDLVVLGFVCCFFFRWVGPFSSLFPDTLFNWKSQFIYSLSKTTTSVTLFQYALDLSCTLDEKVFGNAFSVGSLTVLKFLKEKKCPWNVWTCGCAAEGGHLEALKWARENGCPWNERTCSSAAVGGYLEVLIWVRENGCPWDEYTCCSAASGGHLEVLKWARENGCPWNRETCSEAASRRHLEVLKWARENPWKEHTRVCAALGGCLEVLKWVSENGCPSL